MIPNTLLTGSLPELPAAEQWKKDTQLNFSPRSGELKAIDAALKTYSEKRAEYNELSAQNRDKCQPYMASLVSNPGHHEPRQPYLEHRDKLDAAFGSARSAFKTALDGVAARTQTKGQDDKRDYKNAVTDLKIRLQVGRDQIETLRDQLNNGRDFIDAAETMARNNTLQQKAELHARDMSQQQSGPSAQPFAKRESIPIGLASARESIPIVRASASESIPIGLASARESIPIVRASASESIPIGLDPAAVQARESILTSLDQSLAGRNSANTRASQASNSPSENARTNLSIIEEYGRSSPGRASPTQPQRRSGQPPRSSEDLSPPRSPSPTKGRGR